MPRFLTTLDARQLDDRRWELLGGLVYESAGGLRVCVPDGFVTDFASVPRLPLVYLLAGGTGNAAAVIHDYEYQTHETSKEAADDLFREALGVLGEPRWRRLLMYWAVRWFGGAAYRSGPTRYEVLNTTETP